MNDNAFLETPNAIRRRKVLMYLLTPVVGTRSSLDAVVLWEKQFGSTETLLAFVVEYSKLLFSKLDIEMDALLFSSKFIQALLKPPEALLDVHDPVGMGKILLVRELETCSQNTADNNSVF
jgi:hypothetical protein